MYVFLQPFFVLVVFLTGLGKHEKIAAAKVKIHLRETILQKEYGR